MRSHGRIVRNRVGVLLALLFSAGALGCNLDDLLFEKPAAAPEIAHLALTLTAPPLAGSASVSHSGLAAGSGLVTDSVPAWQVAAGGDQVRIIVGEAVDTTLQTVLDTLVVIPPGVNEVDLLLPIPIRAGATTLTGEVHIEMPGNGAHPLRGRSSVALREGGTVALEIDLASTTSAGLAGGAQISAGVFHACAITAEGRAYCWGDSSAGQLGGTSGGVVPLARELGAGLPSPLASVSAGLAQTCVVDQEDRGYCWGSNRFGALGTGAAEPTSSTVPLPVDLPEVPILSMSAGGLHLCALTGWYDESTNIICWGLNARGQLGDGTGVDSYAPIEVPYGMYSAAVSAGYGHSCGEMSDGVACWGDNTWGQLGDGTTTTRLEPVFIDSDWNLHQISAGGGHTCALDYEGWAYCWGLNTRGQLGTGTTTAARTPVPVAGNHRFSALSAGASHTCALDLEGQAYCWGNNNQGALGNGTTTESRVPVLVGGGAGFSAIAAGYHFTCGILLSGEAVCWGSNDTGQLGDGSRLDRTLPTPVLGPAGSLFAPWLRSESPVADPVFELTGAGLGDRGIAAGLSLGVTELHLQTEGTARLTATIVDQAGNELGPAGVSTNWWSTDPDIVAVDYTGFVTALSQGSATIVASYSAFSLELPVTVRDSVPTIRVSPEAAVVGPGETVQLTATIEDPSGAPIEGQVVVWESADVGVVTVDESGLVTGVAPGVVEVSASSEGVRAAAVITVRAVVGAVRVSPDSVVMALGDTVRLTATVMDDSGAPIDGRTVVWQSADVAVATVDESGLVTGSGAGVAIITASAEGISSAAVVTVAPTAMRMAFRTQPVGVVVAGSPFDPVLQVELQDASGAVVADRSVEVTLTLTGGPGGAILLGTLSATTDAGVATFAGLTLELAGSGYRIQASAADLPVVETELFTVRPAAAERLAFTAMPATVEGQAGFAPAVEVAVFDRFDNLATDWTGDVVLTLELGNNPSDATLAGTLTAPAADGIARFADLSLDRPGTSYTLTARAEMLPPVESTPFDVRLTFEVISAGHAHSCGITVAEAAYCWGDGNNGQLGTGDGTGDILVPVPVVGGLTFATVSAGSTHSCGVTVAGAAYCWGWGGDGRLGTGSTEDSAVPVAVASGLTFAAVSAGYYHSCGVTVAGAAYCWGLGDAGQLGSGSFGSSEVPMAVAGGLTFAMVSVSDYHSCGVTVAGAAYCWGDGSWGQLGNDSSGVSAVPVAVAGGLIFATVSAGSTHSCGVTVAGGAYCWGWGYEGQLGTGNLGGSQVPDAVVGGLTFATVSAGSAHSCGVTVAGAAYCWGRGYDGQLGTGSFEGSEMEPLAVAGGLTFATVSAGDSHSCGVTTAAESYCWGSGSRGQLGTGSISDALAPVRVFGTER